MAGFFTDLKANRAFRLHATGNQLIRKGDLSRGNARLAKARCLYDASYAEGCRMRHVLLGYVNLLMRSGEFAKAGDILLDMNERKDLTEHDKYQIRVDYSICLWKKGELEKAISTIRRAYETAKNGTIYSTMGLFLIEEASQTGDFSEAERFAEEALAYDDEDPALLDNKGQLLYFKALRDTEHLTERMEEALEAFRAALKQKRDQVTTLYFMALACEKIGKTDLAKEYIDRAKNAPYTAMCQMTRQDIERAAESIHSK